MLAQKLPADRVPDDKVPAKRLQRRIGHWALTLVNGQLLCASLLLRPWFGLNGQNYPSPSFTQEPASNFEAARSQPMHVTQR